MPRAPSDFRIHPAVFDDLESIREHNPDHAERCFDKIDDWERQIQWGRVPQERLTYLRGSGQYNFYRERVGNAGYRIVYEISVDVMTVVAVLPKGERTYDMDEFARRMRRQ